MKKAVLFLLFSNLFLNLVLSQKEFTISNGLKSKIVSQSNYFTFYLKDSSPFKKNIIEEGYLLSAQDSNYLVDVFLEEYESHDTLVLNRCTIKQRCQRETTINYSEIIYFQQNNTAKISSAKVLFVLSAASLIGTTYLAANPTAFNNNHTIAIWASPYSNTIPIAFIKINTLTLLAGTGIGIVGSSFGLGIKFLNPKKHFTSKEHKKGGWYISE